MSNGLQDSLMKKLKVLHATVWEHRASGTSIDAWLENFTGGVGDVSRERLHALYLLSHFIYFGSRQMRTLLKSMYRDLYRYSIIESIRRANGDTLDGALIEREFQQQQSRTRFLGIGNPSESGSHLLYFFRQENGLPKALFIHAHEIFDRSGGAAAVRDDTITRYIFIDDFSGSGSQGVAYSRDVLADLKAANPSARCEYHVLFATRTGMSNLKSLTTFDHVDCVYELDDSFKCFDASARCFKTAVPGIDQDFARKLCEHYGEPLFNDWPLGFGDCQLLIGFHHNTPDNTLPIFWCDEPGGVVWTPIFRRYHKNYEWAVP